MFTIYAKLKGYWVLKILVMDFEYSITETYSKNPYRRHCVDQCRAYIALYVMITCWYGTTQQAAAVHCKVVYDYASPPPAQMCEWATNMNKFCEYTTNFVLSSLLRPFYEKQRGPIRSVENMWKSILYITYTMVTQRQKLNRRPLMNVLTYAAP